MAGRKKRHSRHPQLLGARRMSGSSIRTQERPAKLEAAPRSPPNEAKSQYHEEQEAVAARLRGTGG